MMDIVWQLRGRGRPEQHVLDQLHAMHPHWRVAWQPGDAFLPGAWVIYAERQADELWRAAGMARLRRYMAHPGAETPGIRWATEAMIAGLQHVAEFPEGVFGTEKMFRDLRDLLDFEKANAQAIEAALQRQMAGDVVQEAEHTPQFKELVEQTVSEWWPRFSANAHSVFQSGGFTAPALATAS